MSPKTISIMAVLSFMSIAAAAAAAAAAVPENPWAKYSSCYETIERNGVAIAPSERGVCPQGVIDASADAWDYYFDPAPDHKAIPAEMFSIFHQYDSAQSICFYEMTVAFLDRGEYNKDASGDHYRFDGVVYNNQDKVRLKEAIDLQPLSGGQIKLHMVFKLAEDDPRENTYVLKPFDCSLSRR